MRCWRIGVLLIFVGLRTTVALPADTSTLDEVLVTGERPGPGLWRVSKNGHDLWILGVLEPLPTTMTWKSREVDARIAASQVVLAPPAVDPHIGFFRSLGLLPTALKARHRPDGQTLQQALPHALYIRWLALRVRYLNGSNSDESLRPMLVALDLYTHALEAVDLVSDDRVWKSVEKTARGNHVTIKPVLLAVSIDDPKGMIRGLQNIPLEKEIECFDATLTRIEKDIEPMRQRANLWALGDVNALNAVYDPNQTASCLDALDAVPSVQEKIQSTEALVRSLWESEAEKAIEENTSSFAVLPLGHILGDSNWLKVLSSKGFAVKAP